MKQRFLSSILLLVLICACATTDRVRLDFVKTWEGKTADEVISHFGPPSQELDDSQGGRMLLYGGTRTFHLSDFQRQADYFRSHDLEHIFWVNPRGTISRVWTSRTGKFYL